MALSFKLRAPIMNYSVCRSVVARRLLSTVGAATAAVLACSVVFAQVSLRMLPPEAKRGEMQAPVSSRMVINGKAYGMAPGIKLRDANNMIIFPNSVKAPASVRFTVDQLGLVDQVWILTPQEKAMPDRKR